ncbi:MAG: S9 family peptidase, partial [Planctomycetota bacterium]
MTNRYDRITLEDVATFPRPGTAVPRNIAFTPDSGKVTFLKSAEGSLVLALWGHDVASGETDVLAEPPAEAAAEAGLSREEALRRERARLREVGITSYQYAKDADPPVLLVPVRGRLLVQRGDGPLAEVAGADGALDPRLTRDGTKVAFVNADELFVADLVDGGVRRLTHDAEPGLTNGVAEFIAHEELGRSRGFWWSRDGSRIAFAQADSRHVPVFPIVHQGTDEVEVEEHRYPFAGKENAHVRLGVADVATGETTWLDLGPDPDVYLARVAWRADGSVAALVLSRDQRRMEWLVFDPETGARRSLLAESGEPWLNLDGNTRFLDSGEMLRTSERTGFRHLYLHAEDGRLVRQLTDGEWMVTLVLDVDEERRVARFEATKDGVLERHVYEVSLLGGEVTRLTEEPGWHHAVFSPDHSLYVDTWSSLEHAPRIFLRRVEGGDATALHDEPEHTAKALGLVPPELVTVEAEDGTLLHGAVYEPPAADPALAAGESTPPGPAIVSVYGGPHAQRVANEWSLTVELRAQHLARNGYVVFLLDNLGSANRGLAFEGALARRFGTVEVQDQLAGARHLAARPDVDPERIGVFGWSYGGYMTL